MNKSSDKIVKLRRVQNNSLEIENLNWKLKNWIKIIWNWIKRLRKWIRKLRKLYYWIIQHMFTEMKVMEQNYYLYYFFLCFCFNNANYGTLLWRIRLTSCQNYSKYNSDFNLFCNMAILLCKGYAVWVLWELYIQPYQED